MRHKIKKALNIVIKKLEKCFRRLYHKLPVSYSLKTKAKNLYFTVFGCFLKNTPSYIVWKQTRVKKKKKKKNIKYDDFVKLELNKKIAVQLHLFYVDLLDEFISYFNNIPYTFDLFISVVDSSVVDEVKEKSSHIKNVGRVTVKTVANRGRDVAPFVVDFGAELVKYDYICHVHSKKSLYTGSEQYGWRQYLLDGLMGSEKQVYDIFYNFETYGDVALIYPETYPNITYLGHTWLSNMKSRTELLSKLGYIDVPLPKYTDFPIGTMFWGRMEAIKGFFKSGLKTTDFPEEGGQLDGTIAHAFERCLGAVSKLEGYTVMTFDMENETFNKGYGKKNLKQYWDRFPELLEMEADSREIISFDIFDTLIMRQLAKPHDLYKVVELKLKKQGVDISFVKYRFKAEKNLRMTGKKKDYTIDEIYDVFASVANVSKDVAKKIMQCEIDTEIEYAKPREKMVEIYNYIKKDLGKKVFLISDMYLTSDILKRMLNKCGICDYDELRVSCETNLRKDDASVWEAYIEEFPKEFKEKTLYHVGDNEVSDIQRPGDLKITCAHIMSSEDMFSLTNIGRGYNKPEFSTLDSIAMGTIFTKYFDDPFRFNKCKFEISIDKTYDFGYAILGPIVCDYMMWAVKKAHEYQDKMMFMLAREGYLFKNIFDIMKKFIPEMEDMDASYIYTSRRASLVASLRNEDDIKEALQVFYNGTLENLLKKRFGIENVTGIEAKEVHLPADAVNIYKDIYPFISKILDNADKERANYNKYLSKNMTGDKIAVLDIGYSGSIQYYLSKITSKTFDGLYFATDGKNWPLKIEGSKINGRYIENDLVQPASSSYIHRYCLVLETALTSMDNQLIKMNEKGEPVFKDGKEGSMTKQDIANIHQGAMDYATDFFEKAGELVFVSNTNQAVYEELLRMFVENDIASEGLKSLFYLEDDFCNQEKLNIFEQVKDNK